MKILKRSYAFNDTLMQLNIGLLYGSLSSKDLILEDKFLKRESNLLVSASMK